MPEAESQGNPNKGHRENKSPRGSRIEAQIDQKTEQIGKATNTKAPKLKKMKIIKKTVLKSENVDFHSF